MIFDEEMARTYDRWLDTPRARYIESRENGLILELVEPRRGETLLEVGCGTGEHLFLFKNKGCDVTGIDPSAPMLQIARHKLGDKVELQRGRAGEIPFSDNEFDIVSLIMSLEFTEDPEIAIGEAIRVSRGHVFLGVLNSHSVTAIQRRFRAFKKPSLYRNASFFSVYELMGMIKRFLPDANIKWGSVIFLPIGWYGFATGLEEAIPRMRNPFGAFLGLSFSVTFALRTIQNIITDPFTVKANSGQPAQDIVREGKLDHVSPSFMHK